MVQARDAVGPVHTPHPRRRRGWARGVEAAFVVALSVPRMHVTSSRSGFHCPRACPGEATMSHAAFARVDGFGNLISHSPEVLGMANCLDSSTQRPRTFGAYCFKLNFTPTSVIASPIAHPNDDEFAPILYTAANVTGQFTKDKNGHGVECPAGFQNAAVVGRRAAGDGIGIPPGGFFVMFFD